MVKPFIHISMMDGSNLGTGGDNFRANFSGGIFDAGKYVLNGKGYLTVPTPFMNGTGKWTVAFCIDAWTPSSNQYARFARGNNDVPSVFYVRSLAKPTTKLAYASANTGFVTVVDDSRITIQSNGNMTLDISKESRTVFVFRNDGEYITLWINGVKTLQEAASRYSSDKWASKFSIGDDAGGSYYMTHLECSMLKLWDVAISDNQIVNVEKNNVYAYLIRSGSTLYTITDGTLTALAETEITASLFQTYGVDEIPDGTLLVGLTDPEVLYWQDTTDELPNLTLTVKGTPPLPQMFTSKPMSLVHESIAGIDHAAVDASEDVRFAISFDGGTTWKAHDGSAWFDTSDTVPGMLPSTMNSITAEQWAEVVVLDSYMVRFWLPNVTAYVKSVVMHYINP